MALPVPITITPADNYEPRKYTLNDDKWLMVYSRIAARKVAYIRIKNLSTSETIYVANRKTPDDNEKEPLAPGQSMTEQMNPKELWVQRAGTSAVDVVVSVFSYDRVTTGEV